MVADTAVELVDASALDDNTLVESMISTPSPVLMPVDPAIAAVPPCQVKSVFAATPIGTISTLAELAVAELLLLDSPELNTELLPSPPAMPVEVAVALAVTTVTANTAGVEY